jgi:hypothetical protein
MDMIELLLPCGFDTLEYSWVKATIGIYMLADYSVAKKRQRLGGRPAGQGLVSYHLKSILERTHSTYKYPPYPLR